MELRNKIDINISELQLAIQKVIAQHCQTNPHTKFMEVNTAISNVLNANLRAEIKMYLKQD